MSCVPKVVDVVFHDSIAYITGPQKVTIQLHSFLAGDAVDGGRSIFHPSQNAQKSVEDAQWANVFTERGKPNRAIPPFGMADVGGDDGDASPTNSVDFRSLVSSSHSDAAATPPPPPCSSRPPCACNNACRFGRKCRNKLCTYCHICQKRSSAIRARLERSAHLAQTSSDAETEEIKSKIDAALPFWSAKGPKHRTRAHKTKNLCFRALRKYAEVKPSSPTSASLLLACIHKTMARLQSIRDFDIDKAVECTAELRHMLESDVLLQTPAKAPEQDPYLPGFGDTP